LKRVSSLFITRTSQSEHTVDHGNEIGTIQHSLAFPQPSTRQQFTLRDHGVFTLSSCWYSLCLPTEGWPGWVNLGGWLHAHERSPISVL